MNDKKYYLAFSLVPGVGPARFARLQRYFSKIEDAWQAPLSELLSAGIDQKTAEEILIARDKIDLDYELKNLENQKINFVTIDDENYPALLKETSGPPFLLYYKGILNDPRDKFSVAIVGTRKISPYGKQATEKITTELTRHGIAIISGLALGVDTVAHKSCLEEKGRTIAIVGSGLDKTVLYPPQNIALAEEIVSKGGLVISEYPPKTEPHKLFFPQRNRIIAGMSLGTLVVEAPLESGALLTAKIALDQNREVFAVPGNIFSENAVGPNNLLKLGAKPTTEAKDIMESLSLEHAESFVEAEKIIVGDTEEEKLILKFLTHEPIQVDDLKRETKLDSSLLSSTLTIMEMKGKARNMGAMMWVIGR
jgi:DNA processing protein